MCCLGGHRHAGRPIQHPLPIFSFQGSRFSSRSLRVHGPIRCHLDAMKLSFTLNKKTAPRHNVSTFVLDIGDVVLWVIPNISLSSDTVGRCQRAQFWFPQNSTAASDFHDADQRWLDGHFLYFFHYMSVCAHSQSVGGVILAGLKGIKYFFVIILSCSIKPTNLH